MNLRPCILFLAMTCAASAGTVTNLGFTIHWPLQATSAGTAKRPLLTGDVTARLTEEPSGQVTLKTALRLTRPPDEQHRAHWNATLAYPQYGWMESVRVWDKDRQWLWPNLPLLLRATGTQGADRYGGWDAGHHVDNDFAAVLIRAYDADGKESPATAEHPLVTGQWHPDVPDPDTAHGYNSVVHAARSDEFTVPLQTQRGTLNVWLIYADFLRSPPPPNWPKESEFNGGTLKFFTLTWATHPQHGHTLTLQEAPPPEPTRFDWKRWHDRPTALDLPDAPPRLTLEDNAPE